MRYSENVCVFQLTGNKAPQLKRLAQWLLENPMYDVDPKWAELVKERGNLPHDLQKRLPQSERKKGPGRPPLLSSPPGSQASTTQSSSTLSAGNLSFPSLASGLGGINPNTLLSSLSLGGFDPKNNPMLMPFGGMPNMSALSGMGGLGNMGLTNSLFANLASLGLPSLAGLDPSSLGNPATSMASSPSDSKSSKSHKADSKSSSKAPVSSAASTLPTSLPFFFPNPSLLYTPLGLGSLNPFSLQPGSMSSAYDSLALLNGSLGVSATQSQGRGHKNTSTTSVSSGRASTVTSASTSQSKHHLQQQQRLPAQFLLPHDTHLLESLTRSSKPKQSRPTSYSKEQEMKEALETLSKSSTEILTRLPHEDRIPKRTRDEAFPLAPVDLVASMKRSPSPLPKKCKESPVPSPASKLSHLSSGLDLSNHLVAEERTKTPPSECPLPLSTNQPEGIDIPVVNDRPLSPERSMQESIGLEARAEDDREMCDDEPSANDDTSLPPSETKDESCEGDGEAGDSASNGKGKKRRGKKSVDVGQRKMLRSSAGRAAAAAARAREDHSN